MAKHYVTGYFLRHVYGLELRCTALLRTRKAVKPAPKASLAIPSLNCAHTSRYLVEWVISSDFSGKATSCILATTTFYEAWSIPVLFPSLALLSNLAQKLLPVARVAYLALTSFSDYTRSYHPWFEDRGKVDLDRTCPSPAGQSVLEPPLYVIVQ